MKDVIYRDVKKEDLIQFENLINDAFKFDKFIHNKELLKIITSSYLKESICESSFIKVASKDDKVLGFILCKADGDKANYNHLFNPLNEEKYQTSLLKNSRDKNEINEFIKIEEVYSELLSGKENLFDSCINLFIVSEEARGLGIGKTLLNYSLKYMNSMKSSSLYVFTDDRCNYGFYKSQGFNCLDEVDVYLKTVDSNLKTFLYTYSY